MSQEFRLRYDQMRENTPQSQPPGEESTAALGETYLDAGYARHVCFAWPDGKMFFLNYSYLVSGEYVPDLDQIALLFTSHQVQITGVRLQALFMSIMHHSAKTVVCADARYDILDNTDKPLAHHIVITSIEG